MRYGTTSQKTKEPTDQQSTSTALMNVQGTWSGTSVSWNIESPGQTPDSSISPVELKALQKKHGSRNVNTDRVGEVKKLMGQGKTQSQIIQKLRGRRGFGERQIKKDMAALSKLKK
jgi:hypothetical protein